MEKTTTAAEFAKLTKRMQRMQTELDEFKRRNFAGGEDGDEDGDENEDEETQEDDDENENEDDADDADDERPSEAECDARASARPKKACVGQKEKGKRSRRVFESDDDEEILAEVKVKLEKAAKAAKAAEAVEAAKAGKEDGHPTGQKRKKDSDTSHFDDSFDDELVRPVNCRAEREADRLASQQQSIGSGFKRARLYSPHLDCGLHASDHGVGELPSAPGKARRPRPPSAPAPVVKKPLLAQQWTTSTEKPKTKSTVPSLSCKTNKPLHTPTTASTGPNQSKPKDQQTPKSNPSPQSEPRYAEIDPFTFKLIVSYSGPEIDYHLSTDLTGTMKTFWSLQKRLQTKWEDLAGAEWAWELQKTQKARGKQPRGQKRRFCVSRKLEKRPTRWRSGDYGRFACRTCAENAALCFTWVADEDDDNDDDEEEEVALPSPKGEFWCLPIHPDDRRCVVTKDREIRTWLNEGDNSESDSSGEDVGESSEFDEFKVGSDFGDLSLSESSSSSEEENARESDDD